MLGDDLPPDRQWRLPVLPARVRGQMHGGPDRSLAGAYRSLSRAPGARGPAPALRYRHAYPCRPFLRRAPAQDRKSAVSGKSVSVRVDLGGRRIIKKTKKNNTKME